MESLRLIGKLDMMLFKWTNHKLTNNVRILGAHSFILFLLRKYSFQFSYSFIWIMKKNKLIFIVITIDDKHWRNGKLTETILKNRSHRIVQTNDYYYLVSIHSKLVSSDADCDNGDGDGVDNDDVIYYSKANFFWQNSTKFNE